MTHVAFADDAALGIELGHRVGAVPDAVLTSNAGFGGVKDNTGGGVLFEGVNGAAAKTIGREAVVAAHGEIVAVCIGPSAAFDLANSPPAEIGRVAVLFIACDLAGAAADALCHIDMEAVLFAWEEWAARNERGFYFCRRG